MRGVEVIRLGVAQTVARDKREAREVEKQIRCRAVLTRGYCQKYVALASRDGRWRDTGEDMEVTLGNLTG